MTNYATTPIGFWYEQESRIESQFVEPAKRILIHTAANKKTPLELTNGAFLFGGGGDYFIFGLTI